MLNKIYRKTHLFKKGLLVLLGLFFLNSTGYSQEGGCNPVTAPTSQDEIICSTGTVTFTASGAGVLETYQWYDNTTTPIAGATGATYTTPVLSSDKTYFVSIKKGNCESSFTQVKAIVANLVAPSVSSNPGCADTDILLSAGGAPIGGSYQWYDANDVAIPGATSATYTANVSATTNFYVSIKHGNCESPKSAVSATIIDGPSVAATNPQCGGGTYTLVANGAAPTEYYKWYDENMVDITNTHATGNFNESMTIDITSNTTVYASIVGSCETAKTAVPLSIVDLPTPPEVIPNAICGPGSITLEATGAQAGEHYQWYDPFGNLLAGETNATYTTEPLQHSMTYYVSIVGPQCESEKVNAFAFITTIGEAPSVSETSRCGEGKVTLQAVSQWQEKSFQWYNSAGPIAGATGEYFETDILSVGTHQFWVSAINIVGCESEKTATTVTVHGLPGAPSAADVSDCTYNNFTLTASGAIAGESYQWYFEGNKIQNATSATYVTPVLKASKTYQVSIINALGCEGPKTDVNAIVLEVDRPLKPVLISGCDGGNDVLEKDPADNNPNYVYYWQTKPNNKDESNSAQQYVPTQTGVYYLRAKDQTSGCWSRSSEGRLAIINSATPDNNANKPVVTGAETYAEKGTYNNITDLGNYVRTYVALSANTDATDFNMNADKNAVGISTGYVDGLGRAIQSVTKAGSPAGYDVIQAAAYDHYGRQPFTYLPYVSETESNGSFKASAFSDQYDFYMKDNDNIVNTGKAYAEKKFEKTPLHRVIQEFAPGETWVGSKGSADEKSIDFHQRFNNADEVFNWIINNDIPEISSTQPFVKQGLLMVSEVKDEHNNLVVSYTDKTGNVILKKVQSGGDETNPEFAETYYLYDDYNALRFVFPPQFMEEFSPELAITEFLEKYAFQYKYDSRKRVIAKRVPGVKDWTVMVYDKLDRLIMTQDAVQKPDGKWFFTKYDELNRPVMTGIFTDVNKDDVNNPDRRVYFQNHINSLSHQSIDPTLINTAQILQGSYLRVNKYEGHKKYEASEAVELMENWSMTAETDDQYLEISSDLQDYSGGIWAGGYFDNTFPGLENAELLSISYYDNYDFTADGSVDYAYIDTYDGLFMTPTAAHLPFHRLNGVLTGSKVKNLKTGEWITTVSFYDDRGRIIQSQADNHLGGKDIITNAYDFTGKVMQTIQDHQVNGTSRKIITTFEYDHGGRLLSVKENIDGQGEEVMAQNTYNELGELISKDLGTDVQTVDFKYNVRGWLTDINDVNNMADDVFSMQLSYNKGFEMAQFNGNISGQKWKTASDNVLRAYGYQYDQLNRLKRADYAALDATLNWNGTEDNHYTTFDINYDLNGNILYMARQGLTAIDEATEAKTYSAMDRIGYHYSGNKLLAVDDKIDGNTKGLAKDFYDKDIKYCASNTDEYTYDDNGNLTKDVNKGIESISYNHLNLPNLIDFGNGKTIAYAYDAAGIKLQKTTTNENGKVTVTDYIGGMVYENAELQFIQNAEGRVVPEKVNGVVKVGGKLEYEYILKDHLGNARVTTSNKSLQYLATMETTNAEVEKQTFGNVEETLVLTTGIGRNSDAASLLVPALEDEHGALIPTMGLGKTLKVAKGDVVSASVYAMYYQDATNVSYTYGSMNVNNPVEGSSSTQGGVVGTNTSGETAPQAYITMVFTPEGNSTSDDPIRLPVNPATVYTSSDIMELEITVAGELTVFLSNESETDIFFDDFEIKHKQKIVQENHYYGFGMQITGIGRSGDNKFLYNGKEHNEDTEWDDYGARMYNSQLGRWHNIDPLADQMRRHSPYNYAFDNPIRFIDPDGMKPDDTSGEEEKKKMGKTQTIDKSGDRENLRFDFELIETDKYGSGGMGSFYVNEETMGRVVFDLGITTKVDDKGEEKVTMTFSGSIDNKSGHELLTEIISMGGDSFQFKVRVQEGDGTSSFSFGGEYTVGAEVKGVQNGLKISAGYASTKEVNGGGVTFIYDVDIIRNQEGKLIPTISSYKYDEKINDLNEIDPGGDFGDAEYSASLKYVKK